jgi:hypothetical protein
MPAPAPGTPPAAAADGTDVAAVDDAAAPAGPTVGTPVLGEILVVEVPEALVIPPEAILRGAGTPYVLVADQDGRAARRDIRLGVVTSQLAQVVEGLQVGDIVITSGLTELTEGDRVRYSR